MKKFISFILVAVVVGGAAFYGGMQYGKSSDLQTNNFQNFRNLTPEQRQQRMQQLGGNGANGGAAFGTNRGAGQNGTMGEILSKDDKSITVKLATGGSKIVFYSDSTRISKQIDATKNDLSQGINVRVNGPANSDGSITAQSIQIVPAPVPPKAS